MCLKELLTDYGVTFWNNFPVVLSRAKQLRQLKKKWIGEARAVKETNEYLSQQVEKLRKTKEQLTKHNALLQAELRSLKPKNLQ